MLLTRNYWYVCKCTYNSVLSILHFNQTKSRALNLSAFLKLVFASLYTLLSQRAGAVFPQRSERAAPVFTPPQTQPLSSYPPNVQTSDTRQEAAEPSAESEFPSLRCIYRSLFVYELGPNLFHIFLSSYNTLV